MTVGTYGLTHVAVSVRDLDRSSRFYREVFGMVEIWRDGRSVQLQTPGHHDCLALELKPVEGDDRGVEHFGFRLTEPGGVDLAGHTIPAAGGEIRERGEFAPGEPYLFATDPDGHLVEIWYEPPATGGPGGAG